MCQHTDLWLLHAGCPLLCQVGHLEHLVKLYSRGDIPHCDWLDMLTLKAREGGRRGETRGNGGQSRRVVCQRIVCITECVFGGGLEEE